MSVTKSHSPRSITLSTISVAVRSMYSSSARMLRGVNARLTSSRYRVWRGGSIISISMFCCANISSSISNMKTPPRSFENSAPSRLARTTSSYEVTDQ